MKRLKFLLAALAIAVAISALTGCGDAGRVNQPDNTQDPATPSAPMNALIAYFSCTGTTAGVAQKIAAVTGGAFYEITPVVPYTAADLDYNDSGSRSQLEQRDTSCRPEIAGGVGGFDAYDIIFLGYPVWNGQAPKIVYTFLESYDFSGKTIVPFCTSGSSGVGSSAVNLHGSAPAAVWKDGTRFAENVSDEAIATFIDGMELKVAEVVSAMTISAGDTTWTATLADNSSAEALIAELRKAPITIAMSDYGDFEKVGSLGVDLPRNDERITTSPGDLILYQGNRFVIYYGTNSWNFTRIGKIENVTKAELLAVLGDGDVTIVLSLARRC